MNKATVAIVGLFVPVLLIAILFPTINGEPKERGRPQVQNDELQLVMAIRAYYTEYGYYPTLANEAIRSDKSILSILIGTETTFNYRKIVFLEISPAKKKAGRWIGGLNPETGSWVDPYGNPYWLKIDADYDGIVYNPYDTNAGDKALHYPVIVWSPGKDGIFGNPNKPGDYQGSKDIISWQ